jgi:hypothetical protein
MNHSTLDCGPRSGDPAGETAPKPTARQSRGGEITAAEVFIQPGAQLGLGSFIDDGVNLQLPQPDKAPTK